MNEIRVAASRIRRYFAKYNFHSNGNKSCLRYSFRNVKWHVVVPPYNRSQISSKRARKCRRNLLLCRAEHHLRTTDGASFGPGTHSVFRFPRKTSCVTRMKKKIAPRELAKEHFLNFRSFYVRFFRKLRVFARPGKFAHSRSEEASWAAHHTLRLKNQVRRQMQPIRRPRFARFILFPR